MRYRHDMRFGALYGEASTRFRLWAPACETVRLELGEAKRGIAMRAAGDGWHEATVEAVRPGEKLRVPCEGPGSSPTPPRASIRRT
jgi:1,4-alpha-glucan branching enzyme